MIEHRSDVLIIGGGAAGLTAAIYAARAGLAPLLVQGEQPGGQLATTTEVENYPGFADAIQGPWLMEQMQLQAERVGLRTIHDTVESVDFARRPFRCTGTLGNLYIGESVIVCTGARARWLGVPGEDTFQGYGVSACATCDGFFFRGQHVVVVGGGNTAAEEALYLANLAERVTLVHRREALRAERILQDRVRNNPKIEIVWNSVVRQILGDDNARRLTGVVVEDVRTRQRKEIACAGVFVAIGHDPATKMFRGQLALDNHGYIRTCPDSMATTIEGVFAAGDCRDPVFRQAVTAAGMGCMAALEAEKYLGQARTAA